MRSERFDTGADIKVMETEAFRQQKADEQASTEQQPQEPFMSFSPDEAAAARNAAAQEAAQRKAGAAAPPDQATCVPPSQPAKTLTPREVDPIQFHMLKRTDACVMVQVLDVPYPGMGQIRPCLPVYLRHLELGQESLRAHLHHCKSSMDRGSTPYSYLWRPMAPL